MAHLLAPSQDRVIHLTPTELRFFKTRGTAKDGKIWKKVDLNRGEIAVAVDDTVIFQVRESSDALGLSDAFCLLMMSGLNHYR